MDDHYLMTVFDKVAEGLRRGFLQAIICSGSVFPRALPPRAMTIRLRFVHVKNLLKFRDRKGPARKKMQDPSV